MGGDFACAHNKLGSYHPRKKLKIQRVECTQTKEHTWSSLTLYFENDEGQEKYMHL